MTEKLGLIFPRFRYPSGDFPLGISILAAYVKREMGMDVVICDTTFDPRLERVAEFLERETPSCVGVGMSTLMLGEGLQAARMAHERGIPVFVGGPHPTTNAETLMEEPFIDATVIGEGEKVTVELLKMFRAGERYPVKGAWVRGADGTIWPSSERQPILELDDLPFPDWDNIDMDAYLAAWGQLDSFRPGLRGVNMTGSRGCPFSCSFCQPVLDKMFGKKLRLRSPESLVAEIVELKRRFNIEGVWFTDDTFTLYFLGAASCVGDDPMPVEQLAPAIRVVLNRNRVRERETRRIRVRLLFDVLGLHGNVDALIDHFIGHCYT